MNTKPRAWPAGGKKPNDLGLFDMHGNIFTWCQERCKDYPGPQGGAAVEDKEDILDIKDKDGRVVRGGAFNAPASSLRSAFRNLFMPAEGCRDVGIRPARTFR
jgi:formylglycine-generating enzyme required for sulfatase activity